jgi:hypothetical protein
MAANDYLATSLTGYLAGSSVFALDPALGDHRTHPREPDDYREHRTAAPPFLCDGSG